MGGDAWPITYCLSSLRGFQTIRAANLPEFITCRADLCHHALTKLLGPSCPAAIGRLVIPIRVYPVKRQAVWAFTHIFKKVFEFLPAIADRNPLGSVILPDLGAGVGDPFFHGKPAPICNLLPPLCVHRSSVLFVPLALFLYRSAVFCLGFGDAGGVLTAARVC